jgi:hypothetical protein
MSALGVGAATVGATELRWAAEDMAYHLSTYLLAEKLPPERVETTEQVRWQTPDGWWQTLRHQYRQRWWVRWSLGRWPVRMQQHERTVGLRVDLDRWQTFPRAQVTLPEFGRPVAVATAGKHVWIRAEPGRTVG